MDGSEASPAESSISRLRPGPYPAIHAALDGSWRQFGRNSGVDTDQRDYRRALARATGAAERERPPAPLRPDLAGATGCRAAT